MNPSSHHSDPERQQHSLQGTPAPWAAALVSAMELKEKGLYNQEAENVSRGRQGAAGFLDRHMSSIPVKSAAQTVSLIYSEKRRSALLFIPEFLYSHSVAVKSIFSFWLRFFGPFKHQPLIWLLQLTFSSRCFSKWDVTTQWYSTAGWQANK